MLNDFLSGSAAWGVLLTLAAFALGALINRITGKAIFNPLLLGSIFVIIFLSVCTTPETSPNCSVTRWMRATWFSLATSSTVRMMWNTMPSSCIYLSFFPKRIFTSRFAM